jgi:hypothetical protein
MDVNLMYADVICANLGCFIFESRAPPIYVFYEMFLRCVLFKTFLQMVLTFNANGGGSFMTGDLNMKLVRESTSTLSSLNLPWYFEREPDDYFYLAGSMNWSPIMSLNATLPTSTEVHVLTFLHKQGSRIPS